MTFEDIARGCTPEQRDQLAWFLAQLRARRTYEELRICPSTQHAFAESRQAHQSLTSAQIARTTGFHS